MSDYKVKRIQEILKRIDENNCLRIIVSWYLWHLNLIFYLRSYLYGFSLLPSFMIRRISCNAGFSVQSKKYLPIGRLLIEDSINQSINSAWPK